MKKVILYEIILSVVLTMLTVSSCKKPDKLVALSFDDGPNSVMTELVLDKLKKHHVPGTFFVIGKLVTDETAPTLKRMVEMGCEINNHSWEYESMDHMNEEQVKKSISRTNEAVEKYTGQTPKFFRAPNLAVSSNLYQYVDMPFICGVVAKDWQGCNTDAKMRAQNVLDGVSDGAIILMHDVQPYPHPTPEALDILIPALKKQGYEFVTVSELFKRKGITPELHQQKMWTVVR